MRADQVCRKQPLPGLRSRLHTPGAALHGGGSGSNSLNDKEESHGSGSQSSSMTANKMKRRPSRKGTLLSSNSFTSTGATPKHHPFSRASTSSDTYSTDEFAYGTEDTNVQQEGNPMFLTATDDSEYVEMEATLPPMDFDRPKTVHSNVRPPSRESSDSKLGGGGNSLTPNKVIDGYNL